MSYLGNSPAKETILRLEARKSFALSLWINDQLGRPLDISTSTISLVVGVLGPDVVFGADLSETTGYAQLNLQAADLDFETGEHDFTLVLIDGGYSTVLAKGILDLVPNTDYSSVDSTYLAENPATALQIALRDGQVLDIRMGPTMAPGTTSFTDADKAKLDEIEAGARAVTDLQLVPDGGFPGDSLIKLPVGTGWARVASGGSGLDATDVPPGRIPMANGIGSWTWTAPATVSIPNADGLADGTTKVIMTAAERTKLGTLTRDYAQLQNLPTLGTAASQATTAFLPSAGIDVAKVISGVFANTRLPKVSLHLGFSSGTAAPSGGADGDLYLQYT